MTWVVDASVAVKWFVDEARAVLASGQQIIAPDLISIDCGVAEPSAEFQGQFSRHCRENLFAFRNDPALNGAARLRGYAATCS